MPLLCFLFSLSAPSSSAPQPGVDPFAEEFRAPVAKRDLPAVLPDFLPDNGGELGPIAQKIVDYVDLQASVDAAKVKRGQVIRITIEGTTKPWGYTYSAVKRHATQSGVASKLKYKNADWLTPLYPIEETATDEKKSKEETSYILHDKFQWQQDVYISPDAPIGRQKLVIQPFIQVCTKKNEVPQIGEFCFQPTDYRPLSVSLEILDEPALPPPANLSERSKCAEFG